MSEWWNVNDTDCSSNELASVINRGLAVQQYPIAANRTAVAVGGLVSGMREEGGEKN